MKTYIPMYNMITSKFYRRSDESIPTVDEMLDSGYYFNLGMIEAENEEEAFEILNMRIPESVIERVKKLADSDPTYTKYPRLHTSMSVGDVLCEINANQNRYLFCDSVGWKELSF